MINLLTYMFESGHIFLELIVAESNIVAQMGFKPQGVECCGELYQGFVVFTFLREKRTKYQGTTLADTLLKYFILHSI